MTETTLTEFLLARIAEDEAQGGCGGPDRACDRMTDRMLAKCEADRRIVERLSSIPAGSPTTNLAEGVLSTLALPYADHPDYRDEWRP